MGRGGGAAEPYVHPIPLDGGASLVYTVNQLHFKVTEMAAFSRQTRRRAQCQNLFQRYAVNKHLSVKAF